MARYRCISWHPRRFRRDTGSSGYSVSTTSVTKRSTPRSFAGDVAGKTDVPVRVHSQCHTGDVWGSLRCDCRDQLEAAIAYIAEAECGAVVYMKQEGRGIGLLNKLKAYKLQDLGLNTIEANHYLGYPAEARDYAIAARIVELLEIESIALLSNNPDKIRKLEAEGVTITRRIPVVIPSNEHNEAYLAVKRSEMGHLI